ncbi:MFS transporter [Microbulbifer zhoushanensis]|uniref:MFS transporter n=1 Tax=Microbulbifer TaxID=48073 RepID=UPI001F016747|nr:MFS transporter [Microbulbifer zhoushanensis]
MDKQWWQRMHGFPPLVWIILVGSFFARGTYFMVWPFLAIMLYDRFALGAAEIGVILSVAAVAAALLGFYVGTLSDRYGRRNLLLLGTGLNGLAFILLARAGALPVFIAAISLCCVAQSIWQSPSSALIGDLLPEQGTRELALQFRYFLVNVGVAFGPLVGVWAGLSAQQSTFGLTALSYLALTVAIAWGFAFTSTGRAAGKRRNPDATLSSTIAVLRKDRLFLLVVLANVLTFFIYAHFDSSLVQYLKRSGAPEVVELISSMILVNALTIVLLQFPLLRLLGHWSVHQRIVLGLVVLAVGQLWFALNPMGWVAGWLGASFVVSLAETVLFPTMSIQIDQMAPADRRGSYFGAAAFYALGWSAAPLFGGLVIQWWGGSVLYWICFVLCGVVLLMYRLSARWQVPAQAGKEKGRVLALEG